MHEAGAPITDLPPEGPRRGSIPTRVLNESWALLELPRLVLHGPVLARRPRGDGRPVVVYPGYGTGDATTAPLRAYLRGLGYDVHGWNLGRNRGDMRAVIAPVLEQARSLARAHAQPVSLVGWSLGGVIAREVAREHPELVRRVITFGTPVVGGPKYTTVAGLYRAQGVDLDQLERDLAVLESERPIRVPVTAIYSAEDRVVAWQACLDTTSTAVEHVELRGTHTGLGINPDVYRVVADRLAEPHRFGVKNPL
ncbi:MAG: alpha/beta hydrolase [Acidimicrobiia bacterium]